MTISSSATVSPDASDFRISIYGLDKNVHYDTLSNKYDFVSNLESYKSEEFGGALLYGDLDIASVTSTIDNNAHTINLSANFTDVS